MIFDELKEALKTHRTTVTEGWKEFMKVRDALTEKYSPKYSEIEIAKAKESYDNAVWESEKEVRTIMQETLDKLKEKISGVASKPIDPDFVPTLAVLEKMENPTKIEVDQIVGKFKTNYVCYRAICGAVGGINAGYCPINLEDILKRCDQVEDKVNRALKGDIDSYNYRVLADSVGLDVFADFFEKFFEGYFDDITEELEKEKKNKNFVK